jgi:asparagine synthetase A
MSIWGDKAEVTLYNSSFFEPNVELRGNSLNQGNYTIYEDTKDGEKIITQENVSATYLRQIQDKIKDGKESAEQRINKFWSSQTDLQCLCAFLDVEPIPESARKILEDLVGRR